MFTPINKLISSLPRHPKTSDAIFALSVRKAFKDVLEKSDLPKEILGAISAVTYKNNELSIKVQGLAKTELLMRASGLVRGINKELGRRVVYKIKFK